MRRRETGDPKTELSVGSHRRFEFRRVLRWDGRRWTRQASPSPAAQSSLEAVTATSASNAWAVGIAADSADHSLVLHWNGARWSQVASPALGDSSDLFAVAASSAGNAWAVGSFGHGGPQQPLAIRCC